MKPSNILALALITLTFFTGAYFYPLASPDYLPDQPNAIRFLSFFMLPLISLTLFLILHLIPRVEVHRMNIEKFMRQYTALKLSVVVYLALLYLAWLASFAYAFTFGLVAIVLTALFLYVVGFLLKSFRQNYFIGIITPWTMADERVWEKTHRAGSFTFRTIPVLMLLGILVPGQFYTFTFVGVMANFIFFLVYSYFWYRQLHHEGMHVENAVAQERLLRSITGRAEVKSGVLRRKRKNSR